MSEWQPIETAPKDGTFILVCQTLTKKQAKDKAYGIFFQVAAWWADEEDEKDGRWAIYCDLPSEPSLHFNPTHWMPLPEPPS